jgi:pentatricopeptide repeat protein
MRRQTDFFSALSSVPQSRRIVPDVKAANILMNCYAKLGNLESAQDLLQQMVTGDGEDVPFIKPNIVTFNTLLDACSKAGELDVALSVKDMLEAVHIMPDDRTYTTLIATVARKTSNASGANDPTLAFSLLEEMQSLDIRPNGMTYSALIDVCGRCRRSDLALKGLRIMEDQKATERELLDLPPGKRHSLPAEVGAWTAAIKACGRTPGKIESAIKLFYAMPNYGVYPNTVTCGCLADCLLRQGRTADSLEVLRYMKKNGIAPSEVMYTSLMTSASRLAQSEHVRKIESGTPSAVEVYSELMQSLVDLSSKKDSSSSSVPLPLSKGPSDSSELYQVSLVFQEMKAVGVEPDLACYNALLKACANVGEVQRASEILASIRSSENMVPNDKTWRHIIRAAGKANRIDVALSTWKIAIKELNEAEGTRPEEYRLSAKSAVALLEALIQASNDAKLDRHTQLRLYQLVVNVCEATISGSSYLGMNLVDRESVLSNPRAMITFLHALVALEQNSHALKVNGIELNRKKLRLLGISIAASDCFDKGLPYRLQQYPPYAEAHRIATSWWNKEKCQ